MRVLGNPDRRDLLKAGLFGAGALLISPASWARSLRHEEDPHFFLQIYVYGGIDSLFLFDGRPLSMTGANLMHAYIKEEPTPWQVDNEGVALASPLAREIQHHRQRFSILNGVMMSTGFDGHLQNVNFLYTGNPFGGESFLPHFNMRAESYQQRPLDVIQSGSFALDLNNGGNSILISADSAFNLIESLKKSRPINPDHPVMNYLQNRFAALGAGSGRFSAGAATMSGAYRNSPDLADRLKKLKLAPPNQKQEVENSFIDLMGGCFREGICSAALYQIFPSVHQLDTHAASLAKEQPRIYDSVMLKLRRVFDLLAQTPFDDKRSLFDVTTVMVASEFGRTLRQPGLPLDNTGTDHNSLNNSILIGGKGIRGGQVIGETDWRTPQETLSGAHKQMDPAGIKLMGKPFDFKTGRPRTDLPSTYEVEDYLHMASVTNTLYSLFGVPQGKWRTLRRDGPKAPIIPKLIKS